MGWILILMGTDTSKFSIAFDSIDVRLLQWLNEKEPGAISCP